MQSPRAISIGLALAAFLLTPICARAQIRDQREIADVSAETTALDPWLGSPTLWQTTTDNFTAGRALGFRWVSAARDAARAPSPDLRIGSLPVAEVIARFSPPVTSGGAANPAPAPLAGVQISIYNRGDVGDLDQKKFDALVEQAKTTLTAFTKLPPQDRGTDNTSAVQTRGLVWSPPPAVTHWNGAPVRRTDHLPRSIARSSCV